MPSPQQPILFCHKGHKGHKVSVFFAIFAADSKICGANFISEILYHKSRGWRIPLFFQTEFTKLTEFLFLKGSNVENELKNTKFIFKNEKFESSVNKDGCILKITEVKY